MRLSLRTLLAFEDNVFDVEQHRRLESILPSDKNAEATLQRIRSVVRKPTLGVPGLVDHQEELDPNYVAEYLDHQMESGIQEKFETYCLSTDRFLAEVASVHHVLSNVLGEPARTSRECRLECYDALKSQHKAKVPAFAPFEQLKHFAPHTPPPEAAPIAPVAPVAQGELVTFWKRWFSFKQTPNVPPQPSSPSPTEQKRSPLWTFCVIGMCICTLYVGWQQIERKRLEQQLREATETEQLAMDDFENDESRDGGLYSWGSRIHEQDDFISLETGAIEQAAYATGASVPYAAAIPIPTNDPFSGDPFAGTANFRPRERPAGVELVREPFTTNPLPKVHDETAEAEVPSAYSEMSDGDESIIAFQPIGSLTKISPDRVAGQPSREPLPPSVWQTSHSSFRESPASSSEPSPPVAPVSAPASDELIYERSVERLSAQPITQTTVTVPKILGRAMPMPQPSVIFSADSARASWRLPALPFELYGDQYLLTTTPFRGTFEFVDSFRIEMIGDAKLCVLPLDESGVPGIFVDYGRIVIHPLQADQQLRIEMEKSSGTVSVSGTKSVLFIDTFAEIAGTPSSTKLPEEQKQKGAILGFVPKNGEQLIWKLQSQSQPYVINTQGSMVMQPNQYRFGEIRQLPHWLEPMQMSPEEYMLAEACQRCFVEADGNGEKALTQLIRDETCAIRTLGLRLWGDLGRFDIPITVMVAKKPEDEAVRLVLVRYFDEVMIRDAETIQRFADALEMIKARSQ